MRNAFMAVLLSLFSFGNAAEDSPMRPDGRNVGELRYCKPAGRIHQSGICARSYPRRLQSGQITCYLNRTYHVLTTLQNWVLNRFGGFSLEPCCKRRGG
jgi:hypothetical protein